MNTENWSGLIAATFTPMKDNGELNIPAIPSIVNQLVAEGVAGLYVCGGTGEGISLTSNERMIVAEAYIKAANGKVPVFRTSATLFFLITSNVDVENCMDNCTNCFAIAYLKFAAYFPPALPRFR